MEINARLDKLPTDDNIIIRGCTKSTFYLFFECAFALNSQALVLFDQNFKLQFTTIHDIWLLCDRTGLLNVINVRQLLKFALLTF